MYEMLNKKSKNTWRCGFDFRTHKIFKKLFLVLVIQGKQVTFNILEVDNISYINDRQYIIKWYYCYYF